MLRIARGPSFLYSCMHAAGSTQSLGRLAWQRNICNAVYGARTRPMRECLWRTTMTRLRGSVVSVMCAAALAFSGTASAQDVPAEYKAVLSALGKSGDFKDGVLKVNIPRG